MRLLAGALACLVAGFFGPATSAVGAPTPMTAAPRPASLGIRLVDIPVAAAADARAWRYIIDHLRPGTVIRRRVLVQNQSPAPMRISVYPDAAVIRHGVFIGDAGQTLSELTTWTRLSRHVLALAPEASAMVAVTIRVPKDASPGERYGVIWAQEAARASVGAGFTVREVNRVGVRIYLSVGPGGPPPTDFAIGRLIAKRAQGRPVVVAPVRNTGGRAIDLSGYLELSGGPGGISAGPFNVQLGTTLAPGQSGQVSTILSARLPDGPWHALLRLRSDLTERQARATVLFPPYLAAASIWATAGPWSLAAGVVLLGVAVAAAAWLALGRRRRGRPGPAADQPPAQLMT